MNRRAFFSHAAHAAAGVALTAGFLAATRRASAALAERPGVSPEMLAADETFWREVTREWAPAPDFTNLEYGYFHAAPLPVLEVELRAAREINRRNSLYKRTVMRDDHEAARAALAGLAGTSPEEIAITRNSTESLNTVILGLDLAAGDEIVYSDQDYGSMVEAMEQKAARHGVVLRKVAVPLHPASDEEIVERFAAAMTPRTRLLHVTHMINLTGHVLPVRKICDMAHARGAEVVVDAAHSFAHVDFKVPDLDCDYLGVSLHKWLCAPLGLGLLYVRREKIAKVWPLLADRRQPADNIRKLEHLGTRPESAHLGLVEAIRFHETLGGARKAARLRYLHRAWADVVRPLPRVRVLTPSDPARHGAVGNLAIDGVAPKELAAYWMDSYNIFTAPVDHPVVRGVRVTPGLPTPRAHADAFVGAVHGALKHFA
ncbi:MAG TPA: aminotransferase class V-fold PLP-dependent enzyme [Opitutaceae bacterium]